MKEMFISFIKDKSYILLFIIYIILMVFFFSPIFYNTVHYMKENGISNLKYVFLVFMLPITFKDVSTIDCLILDICYFFMIIYVISRFIGMFMKRYATVTMIRIPRDKVINKIIKYNAFYAVVFATIYIGIFYIGCVINEISLNIDMEVIITIFYKYLITIMLPNMYLYNYIKFDDEMYATIFNYVVYVVLHLLIGFSYVQELEIYKYTYIIIPLFIVLNLWIISMVKQEFIRRDI